MEVGDRVSMSPMWKHDNATGTIEKITKDGYVVVKWDNVPGHWHYATEQAKRLEIVNEKE